MPRGLVTMTSTGLSELVLELEGLVEKMPEISKKAVDAQLEFVEGKVKANWVSMVNGETGGYVYSSVGHSAKISTQNSADVVGTVGVYSMDNVNAGFGITDKDLNAAQIAYWVEFGTSRLTRGRKRKNKEYKDEDLITVNAVPFISNAFFSSFTEQQTIFTNKFKELLP